MIKERYDCVRYIIENVVFIENIPEIISRNVLCENLSQYGKIKKVILHKYNKAHVEFYSIISANLCIKYLNGFNILKSIDKKTLLKVSLCTTLTKPKINKNDQYYREISEPIRYKIQNGIFPSVSNIEKSNLNILNLIIKPESKTLKCIGTGGIYNSLWINKFNENDIYFIPN